MTKRILITNEIEKICNKPVIFLGNWCTNSLNQNIWKEMDYKIFKSKLFNIENSKRLAKETEIIYESILEDIYQELNRLHSTSFTKKFWRITIGPWLLKYTSVFNRCINLVQELKDNENVLIDNEITLCFKSNLQTYDSWDFNNKSFKKEMNSAFFTAAITKIFNQKEIYDKLQNLENLKQDLEEYGGHLRNQKKNYIILKSKKDLVLNNTKLFFLKIAERVFCKFNKFIFYKIYYGSKFSLLKIFFKLKEFPFNYNVPEERKKYSFNKSIRNNLKIYKKNCSINESIIRDFIKISIPSIYLEGFKDVMDRVDRSIFPKKRDIIFTCSILYDYLFKFWAAKQVSQGSKLIYGQHGGNHDLIEDDYTVTYSLDMSDLFLSWGWKGSDKVIPLSCFLTIGKKNFIFKKNRKFVLFLKENNHYLSYNDIIFLNDLFNGEKEYVLKSNKSILNFIELCQQEKLDLYIKTHPNDHRQSVPISRILEKKFEKIKYEKGSNIFKVLNDYELIIFSNIEQTTLLQCLSLNKPFLAFFTLDIEVINPKYRKIFKNLIDAGVFHTSALSTFKFLKKNTNLENWWESEKVKKALKDFSESHVRIDKYTDKKIFKILNNEKSKLKK